MIEIVVPNAANIDHLAYNPIAKNDIQRHTKPGSKKAIQILATSQNHLS